MRTLRDHWFSDRPSSTGKGSSGYHRYGNRRSRGALRPESRYSCSLRNHGYSNGSICERCNIRETNDSKACHCRPNLRYNNKPIRFEPGKLFHIINDFGIPELRNQVLLPRWYRDTFGGDYRELDQGAETVPAGSEGLYFHPYLAGELTPYADPKLCGSFTGIRSGHTRSHFSRAVMEGTAYSLLDCARTIEKIGLDHGTKGMIIGGGAKSPLWSQIVSDCLNLTLYHMENSDSSFGTAMLAGIASGFFRNPDDAVKRCVKIKDIVYPNAENTAFYQKHFEEYKSIQKALAGIYDAR